MSSNPIVEPLLLTGAAEISPNIPQQKYTLQGKPRVQPPCPRPPRLSQLLDADHPEHTFIASLDWPINDIQDGAA
jgi:hypothetical protein